LMRVLAARFADRRIASAVREMLHRQMHVSPPDVDIAPLAISGERETASDDTVLAARFPDQDCGEAAALLRDAGGVIVVNVDERWTRPRSPISGQAWGATLRRERVHV
jgi:hypothetical protein